MAGGGDPPAQPSTTTQIQDVPAWEQSYVTNLLGQAQTIAAQPYQQFPGQQVAGFTDPQMQAFSNIENLPSTYQPTQQAGVNSAVAGANTAGNIYGAGNPLINASTVAASPLGIQAYMSPYTNNVVQGMENEANLNWNQNIMPGINDKFVGAGQYGSGRNAEVLGRAAGNFQTGLSSNIANALQTGYGMAGQQAATEAGLLGSAGSTLGNLAATQGNEQLAAGTALGNLSNLQQQQGLTGAQALQGVGQQQQQLNQTNINTAMQNWQNQTQWPAQQTEYLNQIIRGLPAPSASTSSTQITPAYSVSPLSGVGGAGIGALSLAGANGNPLGTLHEKEGGLIKGYAAGGNVDEGSVTDPDYDEYSGNPLDYTNDNRTNGNAMSKENAAKMVDLYGSGDDVAPEPPAAATPLDAASPSPSPAASANPLTAPPQAMFTPEEMQRNKLLALARGMLTPSLGGSTAAAFGQGLGNMQDVDLRQREIMAQQAALNWQRQQQARRNDIYEKSVSQRGEHYNAEDEIRQQLADEKAANGGKAGVTERLIREYLANNPGATWNEAYTAVKHSGGNNDEMNNIRKETLAQNAYKNGIPIKGNPNPAIDDYRKMYGVKSADAPQVNAPAPGGAKPTQVDIDFLKQNPNMKNRFEGRFGTGTASQYLGQ